MMFDDELRQAIAEQLDAALDDRHRRHAAALFLAGRRDDDIAANLARLRGDDALRRQGLLTDIERAVLTRLGLTDRGDDASTGGPHDGTRKRTD